MSGKQKEGDNKRRRALARDAREQGLRASQAGVTLGASKQFEHLEHGEREGPAPAGGHKWGPETGGPPMPSPPAAPSWPNWEPTRLGEPRFAPAGVGYRDLVGEVTRRARLDFEAARAATAATVTALARSLGEADRRRLLEATPAELHLDGTGQPLPGSGLGGFLDAVAQMSRLPREQARYHAQAALSALADRAGDLVASLELAPELRELFGPPPSGGGVVGPQGNIAPLTEDELRDALARLPYWSLEHNRLTRTLVLPGGNLERVLQRLERLKLDTGRGPHIGWQDGAAVLVVRTNSADAVTRFDIGLAHDIDAAIEEAGAGIDTGA